MIAVIFRFKEVGVEFVQKYLAHLRDDGLMHIGGDRGSSRFGPWRNLLHLMREVRNVVAVLRSTLDDEVRTYANKP